MAKISKRAKRVAELEEQNVRLVAANAKLRKEIRELKGSATGE